MDDSGTHYRSGRRIEVGDRVLWHGSAGRVVFIVSDLPPDDWYRQEFGTGFMLDVEGTGRVLEREADEDLEFVA